MLAKYILAVHDGPHTERGMSARSSGPGTREHHCKLTSANSGPNVQLAIWAERRVSCWVAHLALHIAMGVRNDLHASQDAVTLESHLHSDANMSRS